MVRKFFALVGMTALLVLGTTSTVFAESYGNDQYGNCLYQTGCVPHTIVETHEGLKIAINLTNAQTIPRTGYKIEITPLNGAGKTFNHADIYIDGTIVDTVSPDSDGTGRWFWDVTKYPGTKVKIVVISDDGSSVTNEYLVTIADADIVTPNQPGTVTPTDTSQGQNIITKAATIASEKIISFIRSLPQFVVVAFPYVLFILLLIEIVVLLFFVYRERRELITLSNLIERERSMSAMKENFIQLISHYLRTPLTLLQTGVDSIALEGADPMIINQLKQGAMQLAATLEGIINRSRAIYESVDQTASSLTVGIAKQRTAQKLIVWAPVGFVGIFATGFVYLANNVTNYSVGVIGLLTQLAVFVVLISAVFFSWRYLLLRRRDKASRQAALAQQQAIQHARDQAIDETARSLGSYVADLDTKVLSLPPQATSLRFVKDGIERLRLVYEKFSVANNLKGSRSANQYRETTLKTLFDDAMSTLAALAQQKKLAVSLGGDVSVQTQDVVLTSLVLQTILDNAIAYSTEGGSIEIMARQEANKLHLFVIDHGEGIPDEKMNILFQPFSKVEGAEVFNHEGMGFSLYLDKLVMTYLGGDVQIESVPGQETKATIALATHFS